MVEKVSRVAAGLAAEQGEEHGLGSWVAVKVLIRRRDGWIQRWHGGLEADRTGRRQKRDGTALASAASTRASWVWVCG
jgi:hypothetical protein